MASLAERRLYQPDAAGKQQAGALYRFNLMMKFSTLALRAPAVQAACWMLLCGAQAPNAMAQAASVADPASPQTVTVAARVPMAVDRLTADVVVIDSERLRDAVGVSLADLLRAEAGLQLSRNGGPGQPASMFVRGAGGGNTLVLIDGVRLGSATLGLVDFSALSLAQIERVEVLRGPASSLYGADAVGGVVLVTTRRGRAGAPWSAMAAVGGNSSSEAALSLGGLLGAWDWSVTAAREATGGVSALRPGDRFGNYNPDHDGFTRRTLQAQLGLTPAAGHRFGLNLLDSRLDSQYDASQFLAPDYAQDAKPDFRSKQATRLAAIDYSARLASDWTVKAGLSRSTDEQRSGGSQVDRFDTRRDQASLQAGWTPVPGQQWSLAADQLTEHAEADVFSAPLRRRNTGVALAYVGEFADGLAGVLRGLTLQADLRHDDNSVYGTQNTGRAGLSWALAPGWRVRALAGSTFHAPSFNDLYYPGYGVSTVKPEQGRSVELGLNWQRAQSQAALTVWRNRISNLIAYESDNTRCPKDPAYSFGCAANIGRAVLSGVTLAAQQGWQDWSLRGEYNYLDARDDATGAGLARRARHQLSLHADWRSGDWTLGAASLYTSDRPDGGVVLRGHQTLDLTARWQLARGWQLQGKLLNATNTDIEPVRDYQSPRRQAWLGLRYEGQAL